MPQANYPFTGLKWYRSSGGASEQPATFEGFVASAYGTALYVGDPVSRQSDGSYAASAAGAGSSGVISRILRYKDSAGFVRTNAKYIPASITWTAWQERTLIEIIPCKENMFVACADEALTTQAAADAYCGENVDLVIGTADAGLGLSAYRIDISTHATTNTLTWRLISMLPTDDVQTSWNDATKTNSMWIIKANLLVDDTASGSTTGV
jgi:hypothetical protein